MSQEIYSLISKLKWLGIDIRFDENGDQTSSSQPVSNSQLKAFDLSEDERLILPNITYLDWIEVDIYKDLLIRYIRFQTLGGNLPTHDLDIISSIRESFKLNKEGI